jgi:protein-disulfide isomerase
MMTRKLTRRQTLAGLAATAVGAYAYLSLGGWTSDSAMTPFSPAFAEDAPAAAGDAPKLDLQDMALGAPDAKVTLIEYASFTCPHCAHFHSEIYGKLKAEYIDTGKVRFVYREVYFDRYGLWAAMMARCGGEMKFFGISDILFDTQKEWAGSDDPTVVVNNLKKIARTAGMDDAQVDACLKDGKTAEALVARFEKQMKEYDIQGTPSFVINGEKYSNMSYEDMKKLLDAALAA